MLPAALVMFTAPVRLSIALPELRMMSGGRCEALYREIVRPLGEGDAPMDLIADQAERPSDDLALRAFFELALAASREPALLPFAAQLRYLRGRTSIRHLRAILPPDRPPSAADGAPKSPFERLW